MFEAKSAFFDSSDLFLVQEQPEMKFCDRISASQEATRISICDNRINEKFAKMSTFDGNIQK